jgi:hypothetical protein
MARSEASLNARVVAPPRHAGEPPLLNLQVYMTPANMTTSSIEARLEPARRLFQEAHGNVAYTGSIYGGIYVPAAGQVYEVNGRITAYLMLDPATGVPSLVGSVALTSFYRKSMEYYYSMQQQISDNSFVSTWSMGAGNNLVCVGALHSSEVSSSGYLALYWNLAWLYAAENTSKAALYEASIQLDASGGLAGQGWYVASLWNGTGAFFALCKPSLYNYYSTSMSWSGPCTGWLLINNSNGTSQAFVSGYTYSYAHDNVFVNDSLPLGGGLSGQTSGEISLPAEQGSMCSACSSCIGTLAASMQHMLQETNATAVGHAFAAICEAQQWNKTLCLEVQASVAASRIGNLGKLYVPVKQAWLSFSRA